MVVVVSRFLVAITVFPISILLFICVPIRLAVIYFELFIAVVELISLLLLVLFSIDNISIRPCSIFSFTPSGQQSFVSSGCSHSPPTHAPLHEPLHSFPTPKDLPPG